MALTKLAFFSQKNNQNPLYFLLFSWPIQKNWKSTFNFKNPFFRYFGKVLEGSEQVSTILSPNERAYRTCFDSSTSQMQVMGHCKF